MSEFQNQHSCSCANAALRKKTSRVIKIRLFDERVADRHDESAFRLIQENRLDGTIRKEGAQKTHIKILLQIDGHNLLEGES